MRATQTPSHPTSRKNSESRVAHPRTHTLHKSPLTDDQIQFFKLLDHWPTLVIRGLQLLRESEDDQTVEDAQPCSSDPLVSILASLVHRTNTVEGHKVKGNFECAAAYLGLIMKVSITTASFSWRSLPFRGLWSYRPVSRNSKHFLCRCGADRLTIQFPILPFTLLQFYQRYKSRSRRRLGLSF